MPMKFKWNYHALTEFRTNGATQAYLASLGRKYLAKANAGMKQPGYVMAPHLGPGGYNRAIVNIYTRTQAAKVDNSRNNTLAKLL
jgi:hypothetical protein